MCDRIAKVIAEAELQQAPPGNTTYFNLEPKHNRQHDDEEDDSDWPQTNEELEQRWAANKASYVADEVADVVCEMRDDTCWPDNNVYDGEAQQARDKEDNEALLGRRDRRRWASQPAMPNHEHRKL